MLIACSCAVYVCLYLCTCNIKETGRKCMCALVKDKAAEFFQPRQLGMACHAGAEIGPFNVPLLHRSVV